MKNATRLTVDEEQFIVSLLAHEANSQLEGLHGYLGAVAGNGELKLCPHECAYEGVRLFESSHFGFFIILPSCFLWELFFQEKCNAVT